MAQKMSTRQLRQHTLLPMIGNTADEQLDSVLSKYDAEIMKLYQDRNVMLLGGGFMSWSGTNLTLTDTFVLAINQRGSAGGTPTMITLTGTSFSFSTADSMLYAVVDRVAGTATLTANATSVPGASGSNQEVFVLGRRRDVSGISRLYLMNGQSLLQGQSARLGMPGWVRDTEFVIHDNADPTLRLGFDVTGTTGTTTTLATVQTANRTLTLPDATDTIVARSTTETLNNKTLQIVRHAVATDSTTTGASATLAAITSGIVRLTNASLNSISGIPAGLAGQFLVIENLTGNDLTVVNDDPGATAGNRIYTGAAGNSTLRSTGTFVLMYDAVNAHWMAVGGSNPASSGSSTAIPAVTQVATTAGTFTFNKPYAFFSTSPVSVTSGSTYTHNSVTYTVVMTDTSASIVILSGSAAPLASGTLTFASGTGAASITFSSFQPPIQYDVTLVGGGSGGGGGTGTSGTGGNTTMDGYTAGGAPGTQSGVSGLAGGGGTVTLPSNSSGRTRVSMKGNDGGAGVPGSAGGMGAPGYQGGQGRPGQGGSNSYGGNSANGSGAGGSGGASSSSGAYSGGGGGSGAIVEFVIRNPAATYTVVVGAGGVGGASGGSIFPGYNGGTGGAYVTVRWQ